MSAETAPRTHVKIPAARTVPCPLSQLEYCARRSLSGPQLVRGRTYRYLSLVVEADQLFTHTCELRRRSPDHNTARIRGQGSCCPATVPKS